MKKHTNDLTQRMIDFKRDDSKTLRRKYYDIRYSSYKPEIRLVFIQRKEKQLKREEEENKMLKTLLYYDK